MNVLFLGTCMLLQFLFLCLCYRSVTLYYIIIMYAWKKYTRWHCKPLKSSHWNQSSQWDDIITICVVLKLVIMSQCWSRHHQTEVHLNCLHCPLAVLLNPIRFVSHVAWDLNSFVWSGNHWLAQENADRSHIKNWNYKVDLTKPITGMHVMFFT